MSPTGAEVIRQIKSRIQEVDPSDVRSAVANGNGDAPVLIDAVARAIARDSENRLVRARQADVRTRYGRLTPREREVFAHLISGQLNKQVGFDLGISERTTKIHRRQVLEKMEADSIADLVRMASDLGIAAVGKVR